MWKLLSAMKNDRCSICVAQYMVFVIRHSLDEEKFKMKDEKKTHETDTISVFESEMERTCGKNDCRGGGIKVELFHRGINTILCEITS